MTPYPAVIVIRTKLSRKSKAERIHIRIKHGLDSWSPLLSYLINWSFIIKYRIWQWREKSWVKIYNAGRRKAHQNARPQIQLTKLQPPFFSTGLWHFGHGFVWTVIQLTVSDSSRHFLAQSSHIRHEQGECASDKQLKQNCTPHEHSTSHSSSSSTPIAFHQWGVLGHHLTLLLSSM